MPLIVEAVVSVYLAALIVFLLSNLSPIDGKPCMLYAWHFAGDIASVQEVLGDDGKGDVSAIAATTVTTMAGNQIILHFE